MNVQPIITESDPELATLEIQWADAEACGRKLLEEILAEKTVVLCGRVRRDAERVLEPEWVI